MQIQDRATHFREKEKNGVVYLQADNIPFPHGFSTRAGGVSRAEHLFSLNLGYGRGDEAGTVDENYRRFLGAVFGKGDLSFCAMAPQVHSARIFYADRGGLYPEGDGFYTDRPDVILTVKVADCLPILLADPEKKRIAALHAGWRGTAAGIALKGVAALVGMGSDPESIVAAIGPSIGVCCYEVDDAFYQAVAHERGEAFAASHIVRRAEPAGSAERLYADLAGMNAALLRQAGVPGEKILLPEHCTACEPERFFSHRASGGRRGTMAAAISL